MGRGRWNHWHTLAILALISNLGVAETHAPKSQVASTEGRVTASEKKADLKVTAVEEWDPNMDLVPFNAKEGLRLMLAYTRTQINNVRADESLTPAEKEKQVELLEKFMKSLLVSFRSVTDQTRVTNGIMICPFTVEVPLTMLLPKKFKSVKPSVAAGGCGFLAMTRNYGENSLNGFVFGIGGLVSGQVSSNSVNAEGHRENGQIEIQHSVGVIMPLNGRSPVMKLGDIQGWYLGGGAEFAISSNNRLVANKGAGGIGGYLKIEGIQKPEVAIVMAYMGKNDISSGWRPKGETFYIGMPWANDGTTFRTPPIPLTGIPTTDDSVNSIHASRNRVKKLSSEEVLKLIEESQDELKKVRHGK